MLFQRDASKGKFFLCRSQCPTLIHELRHPGRVPPVGGFFRAPWISAQICCLHFYRCCNTGVQALFSSIKNTCYHTPSKGIKLILLNNFSLIGTDSSLIHRQHPPALARERVCIGEAGGQDKSGLKSKGKWKL